MPNIDAIQPVYYQPLDPYYVHYDNLPLQNIVARQELINSAVEYQMQILGQSVGTQGTLSNRLSISLNPDGSLVKSAVDNSMHSIAYHTDGSYNNGISLIPYVRMLEAERDKLQLIADNATAFSLQVDTPSNAVLFDDTMVEFVASESITWNVVAPNQIKANLTFPNTAIHKHYYDQIPVQYYPYPNSDYKTYNVNSLATPFMYGSLRVYVNGIKLSANPNAHVYVPIGGEPTNDWIQLMFTPNSADGMFTLSNSITGSDVITIDYDIELN